MLQQTPRSERLAVLVEMTAEENGSQLDAALEAREQALTAMRKLHQIVCDAEYLTSLDRTEAVESSENLLSDFVLGSQDMLVGLHRAADPMIISEHAQWGI